MDFYEATPFTVADMPFHGMSTYPYPASQHYPDDARPTDTGLTGTTASSRERSNAEGYRFVYNTPDRLILSRHLTPHKNSYAESARRLWARSRGELVQLADEIE